MQSISLLAAAAAIFSPALADFYIYKGITYVTGENAPSQGVQDFLFFSGPPACSDLDSAIGRQAADDVSGTREGVRCVGCSTAEDNGVQVTELEFNDDTWGHFTFYADRETDNLIDIYGEPHGTCAVDNSDSYDCFNGVGTYKGQSHIRCTTDLAIP